MGKLLIIVSVVLVSIAVYVGALLRGGPLAPLHCTLLPASISGFLCPKPVIHGWNTKEFEPLRKTYEKNFEEYLEAGSQLTVYHKGVKVVDLWGQHPSFAPSYSNTSLQRVFSSGKMVESLVAIMCVDRGLFKWTDTIAQHWPEFAQHGKEKITIAELMRHEAGLFVFDKIITLDLLEEYTRGNPEPLSRLIEQSKPEWLANTRRVYHAMTRGWLLAEVVRRVDPKHRLIHQFVSDEIVQPLGIDLFLAIPEAKWVQIAKLIRVPAPWMIANVLLPFYLGDVLPFLPKLDDEIRTLLSLSLSASGKESYLKRSVAVWQFEDYDMGDPTTYDRYYNITLASSSGFIGTGSALAVIANVFAGKGLHAPSGVRLFSEAATKEAYDCSYEAYDAGLEIKTRFSNAGFSCGVLAEGWSGWFGWGGSMTVWKDPEGVAVGYAMNRMGYHLLLDPRLQRFSAALAESIRNIK